MKIGVISDTHGDYKNVKLAFDYVLSDVNLVIHAGDILNHGPRNPIPEGYNPIELSNLLNKLPIPIHFAKGNCDSDVDTMMIKNFIQAPYLYLVIEGIKIVVTHGDKNLNFYKELAEKYSDILITGHTHNYTIDKESKYIHLNPGSTSIPKNHPNGTCATIDINSSTITIFDLEKKDIIAETKF